MTAAIMFAILILAVIGMPLFAVMGGSAVVNFWREGIDLQAVVIEFYQLDNLRNQLIVAQNRQSAIFLFEKRRTVTKEFMGV